MTIAQPVYGDGTNPLAPTWSRLDNVTSSEYITPAAATGGHTMYLARVVQEITLSDGTILQFVEAHERDSDFGCRAIYCRKSTDAGASWGSPILVYDLGASYSYSVEYLNSPCPADQLHDGKILLVFNRVSTAYGHDVLYVTSSDGGNTWSAPTDVTASVTLTSTLYSGNISSITNTSNAVLLTTTAAHTLTDAQNYRIVLSGTGVAAYDNAAGTYWTTSGSGDVPSANTIKITGLAFNTNANTGTWKLISTWNVITDNGVKLRQPSGLAANTERIVFGADHRYSFPGAGQAPSGIISWSHCMYCDYNYGNGTFTFGILGGLAEGTLASPNTNNQYSNECSIAETAGGNLLMVIRNVANTDPLVKYYSYSLDHGATWVDMLAADGNSGRPSLPGSSNQASLLSCSDYSLYLAWTQETVIRGGMSIAKLSFDDSTHALTVVGWRLIHQYYSGYCHLEEIDSNTLQLAYERGWDSTGAGSQVSYQEIGNVRVGKAFITDSKTAPIYPRTWTWEFNELASGAVPTTGTPVIVQGDLDQRGFGQSSGNATYNGDGLTIDNVAAHAPVIICPQVASRTMPDAVSPGLGSMCVEVEYTNSTSSTLRHIFDNRDNSGQGITCSLSALHRPQLALNDGTTALTLAPSSGSFDNGTFLVQFCYVRGGACTTKIYDSTGTLVSSRSQADTLSGSIVIRGTQAAVVGRASVSAAAPFNGSIRRIRITIGTTPVTPLVTTGGNKTSLANYLGAGSYTTAPVTAPISAGRVLWLFPSYEQGYDSGLDRAGGYNKPRIPVLDGQGFTRATDVTGNMVFDSITDDSWAATWYQRDTDLGLAVRHVPAATAGQSARTQLTTLNANLDCVQNTNIFTLIFRIKEVIATGTERTILDNITANLANKGWRVFRTSGDKLGMTNSLGDGSNGVYFNLTTGFTNCPSLSHNAWLFVIRGTNDNVSAATVQLSYAQIQNGRVGTVVHLTPQSVIYNAAASRAATGLLTFGSDVDGGHQNDMLGMDVILYNTTLTDAQVTALGPFFTSSLPVHRNRTFNNPRRLSKCLLGRR